MESFESASEAKERLLVWAEESDARKLGARSSLSTIAVGGALAVLGGFVISNVLMPPPRSAASSSRARTVGERLIDLALVARTVKWLLPYAIRVVKSN